MRVRRNVAPSDAVSTPIKGVVFDKDGTIIDFHATWGPAYARAARELAASAGRPEAGRELLALGGYDPDARRVSPGSLLAGASYLEIAGSWAAVMGVEDIGAFAQQLERVLAENAVTGAVPVPDLVGCFQRLRARGLQLGIATNDGEAVARETLEHFGIEAEVDFVAGYDSGYGAKPDPGMIDAFCDQCGLTPSEVVMVGDTPVDIAAGRAAGAGMVVGVLTGAYERDVLEAEADHVVDDIGGVEELLSD